MIRLTFHLVARLHWWLQEHAPTNRLVNAARTRPGWKWAPIALGVSIACFLTAAILTNAVADGAPEALNLVVLVMIIDAIKTMVLAPISLIWTIRAKLARTAR